MTSRSDKAVLACNIAAAILAFVAVLSIVAKNVEASVTVGLVVMGIQLFTIIKDFMESSSTNRILNRIETELRDMKDMMHGQYHSSNIRSATTPDVPATGFDAPSEVRREVVAHPNDTEAIVRDLIDDMLTAVVDGMPLVRQTPSFTERMTADNVARHEEVRDADLSARDAEIEAMREPKKTV